MLLRAFQVCAAASLASATNLFVASYSGNITTLSLTESNGSYTLKPTHYNDGCAPNPSWLTLDPNHGTLYCLDEGLEVTNGTLSSFTINDDGSLNLVKKVNTISGPVSGVIYGNPANNKRAIALAHYSGSAISDWTLSGSTPGNFTYNQDIPFTLNHTGPNFDRQNASHIHEVVLDPTGQYILSPDLGADLVRVFSFSSTTLRLTAETPLAIEAGQGPRHIVFYHPYGVVSESSTTYMFLVTELGNEIISYRVSYPEAGGLAFEKVANYSAYGELTTPVGNAAAELQISPDNRFLILSNRNDSSFSLPNPDPNNATAILSDSMSTFELNYDGTLTFTQLWPAGGLFPRHFSLNKWGTLAAVALQETDEVVILSRDATTGNLGKPVARIALEGNLVNVQWQE